MNKSLYVLLLLASPLAAAPEMKNSSEEDVEEHAQSGVSGEHLQDDHDQERHLELEDPAEVSASTEVQDENHAWYQRSAERRTRRSLVAEEAAEQVNFMLSQLRRK